MLFQKLCVMLSSAITAFIVVFGVIKVNEIIKNMKK
jgi:hypothetical protein